MTYDFDTVLSRKGTSSMKWDKYRNSDVLPFWVADMDFQLAPEITDALKARLEHPIFGYTNASDELVDAVTNHLAEVYDWQIHADWLVWLPGVVPGLSACCRAFLSPGDDVMTNPPIYHHFFRVHNQDDNTLLQVPLKKVEDRWTWDIEAMEAAMTPRTKLLLLCSPHNPTGTVFTHEELTAVCELAARHGAIVVSDEIHCGLVHDPSVQHIPAALIDGHQNNVVTLMSQSKTFNLAGMNCSFAIIPNPELREKFGKACLEVMPMVTTMAYESATAAFEKGEPWRKALLTYLQKNYQLLKAEIDAIPGLRMERCDATYLAWIDATELKLEDTRGYFEQRGVGMSSGEEFGHPAFLRFNFACPESTMKEGIARIRSAVDALQA